MKSFIKCEICNTEISGEKCIFAAYKLEIDGKEHYFCCQQHAKDFKKGQEKPRSAVNKQQ